MSKNKKIDISALYRLEFYRRQNKWELSKDRKKKKAGTLEKPKFENNVDHPVTESVLNEALLDSGPESPPDSPKLSKIPEDYGEEDWSLEAASNWSIHETLDKRQTQSNTQIQAMPCKISSKNFKKRVQFSYVLEKNCVVKDLTENWPIKSPEIAEDGPIKSPENPKEWPIKSPEGLENWPTKTAAKLENWPLTTSEQPEHWPLESAEKPELKTPEKEQKDKWSRRILEWGKNSEECADFQDCAKVDPSDLKPTWSEKCLEYEEGRPSSAWVSRAGQEVAEDGGEDQIWPKETQVWTTNREYREHWPEDLAETPEEYLPGPSLPEEVMPSALELSLLYSDFCHGADHVPHSSETDLASYTSLSHMDMEGLIGDTASGTADLPTASTIPPQPTFTYESSSYENFAARDVGLHYFNAGLHYSTTGPSTIQSYSPNIPRIQALQSEILKFQHEYQSCIDKCSEISIDNKRDTYSYFSPRMSGNIKTRRAISFPTKKSLPNFGIGDVFLAGSYLNEPQNLEMDLKNYYLKSFDNGTFLNKNFDFKYFERLGQFGSNDFSPPIRGRGRGRLVQSKP